MRNLLLARVLFASVLVVLVVQHYVARKFGEPYPSLYLPSFAGDFTKNGKIQAISADVKVRFCNGTLRVLTPNEFLQGLPGSYVLTVMDWMFGPRSFDPRPLSPRQQWLAHYLSPAYGRRILRSRGMNLVDEPTRQWLIRRLSAQYQARPASITCLWFLDTYSVGPQTIRSRELTSEVPVTLGPCDGYS